MKAVLVCFVFFLMLLTSFCCCGCGGCGTTVPMTSAFLAPIRGANHRHLHHPPPRTRTATTRRTRAGVHLLRAVAEPPAITLADLSCTHDGGENWQLQDVSYVLPRCASTLWLLFCQKCSACVWNCIQASMLAFLGSFFIFQTNNVDPMHTCIHCILHSLLLPRFCYCSLHPEICLVGRNGAGKSTLLRILAEQTCTDTTFSTAEMGTMKYTGQVTCPRDLRVAFVEQEPPISNGTLFFFLCAHAGGGGLAQWL
jgi:ABC transporter